MDWNEAEQVLADAEVVACLEAPLLEAKALRDACLAAEIPVLLDRGGCCGVGSGCGCPPKLQLFARSEDVPRVGHLMHERWRELAMREGTIDGTHPSVAHAGEGEDPPCPACGTAAPLVEGACRDCGLQLE